MGSSARSRASSIPMNRADGRPLLGGLRLALGALLGVIRGAGLFRIRGAFGHPLLELARGLAQRPGEIWELLRSEEEDDQCHDADDDPLVHQDSRPSMSASSVRPRAARRSGGGTVLS